MNEQALKIYGVLVSLVSLINLLSALYRWKWWWRLARFNLAKYTDQLTVRVIYGVIGYLGLCTGLGLMITSIGSVTRFDSYLFAALISTLFVGINLVFLKRSL